MLDWSETPEEVIILLAVPASAQKHEVDYKLRPTQLTVSVQGVELIQAKLSHPVQPEDSSWQFGKRSHDIILGWLLKQHVFTFKHCWIFHSFMPWLSS